MPTDAFPPNTVMLSQMMRELSAQPGFTEAFLQQLQGGSRKAGPALLTPRLVDDLRKLILGNDWQGLDRFPGWTMGEITPAVGALSRVVANPHTPDKLAEFLDVGPYSLAAGGTVADFRQPSQLPGFAADDPITKLGYGMTRPDGPSPLAPEHADSARLAYVLNRLSANGMDGVPPASAIFEAGLKASTPDDLLRAIAASGHSVIVTDHRAFANFAHLHWNGQDVMAPFFLNSLITIPGTERPLLVPASHAEYDFRIRGPRLNADMAFYFDIDGKTEFRTMDQLDQAWVMGRDAHTYRGADAIEVTRLAGAVVRTYLRLHRRWPEMPFHGYYAFGVCQDVVAAIELKMTGKTTLFPNTADERYFTGPNAGPDTGSGDAEINDLIRRLPKDRGDKPPDAARIFGSLPVGSSEAELATVTVPGLAPDLIAVHDAWTNGTLRRTHKRAKMIAAIAAFLLLAAARAFVALRHLLRRRT